MFAASCRNGKGLLCQPTLSALPVTALPPHVTLSLDWCFSATRGSLEGPQYRILAVSPLGTPRAVCTPPLPVTLLRREFSNPRTGRTSAADSGSDPIIPPWQTASVAEDSAVMTEPSNRAPSVGASQPPSGSGKSVAAGARPPRDDAPPPPARRDTPQPHPSGVMGTTRRFSSDCRRPKSQRFRGTSVSA